MDRTPCSSFSISTSNNWRQEPLLPVAPRRDRCVTVLRRLQKARLRSHSIRAPHRGSMGHRLYRYRHGFRLSRPGRTAAAVSILAAIPSYRLGKLISDFNKEILNCFDLNNDKLRFSITETLGCILTRDDLVTLCENSVKLLDRVSSWWFRIGGNMLDRSDAVSRVAFESVGRLFREFD